MQSKYYVLETTGYKLIDCFYEPDEDKALTRALNKLDEIYDLSKYERIGWRGELLNPTLTAESLVQSAYKDEGSYEDGGFCYFDMCNIRNKETREDIWYKLYNDIGFKENVMIDQSESWRQERKEFVESHGFEF